MHAFHRLPYELISLIVDCMDNPKDLYQCALINKPFYAATMLKLWYSPLDAQRHPQTSSSDSKHLLKAMSVQYPYQHSLGQYIRQLHFVETDSPSAVIDLVTRSPLLELLTIRSSLLWSYKKMEQLFQQCTGISSLYLGNVYITQASLASLAKHCCHLRKLNLSLLDSWPLTLTPEALEPLVLYCPLENLILGNMQWSDSEAMAQQILRLKRLIRLELVECKGTDRRFMQCFIPTDNDDDNDNKNNNDDKETIPLPRLKHFAIHLVISDKVGIGDTIMIAFLTSHPHIETLSLGRCQISEATFDAILPTTLPRFAHLYLTINPRISSQAVRRLIQTCPTLRSLDLLVCGIDWQDFPEFTRTGYRAFCLDFDMIKLLQMNETTRVD